MSKEDKSSNSSSFFLSWNQDITKCKKEKDFPKELSNYIEYLEKELEVPISIVSRINFVRLSKINWFLYPNK
ncbi:adenylosuccinate synthetase [bacterium]|nr:adenylosuccinate synthetase [bacterium]